MPTLCADVAGKRSPEVIEPDQKRVLKCCLVCLGRADLVLESTAAGTLKNKSQLGMLREGQSTTT